MSDQEIEQLARELWWPHHQSRKRDMALAELDSGDIGTVTLEFQDFIKIAKHVLSVASN